MGSSGSKATPSTSGGCRSKYFGGKLFRPSCLRIKSRDADDDEQVCDHRSKEITIIAPCTNQTVTEQDRAKEYFRKVDAEQSDDVPCISSNAELNEWDHTSITDTASQTGSSSARANEVPSVNPSSRFLSRFSFIPGNVSFRLSLATSLGSSRTMLNIEDELHLPTEPSTSLGCRDESQEGIHTETESNGRLNRRHGAQEPVDRNVRFSRTLSVGRLRDRVLHRSSLTDLTFSSLQQEREVRDMNHGDHTRTLVSEASVINAQDGSGYPPSNMSNSFYRNQDYEVETIRPREARYHDLLEHRSNFLERRRRIRSQVRALQRLGSRYENVSGHERSCILSGQQRTGRCTCRTSNREVHPNDNSSARASISRIVMLAEALFEVLDEIHQQSVVLSSRPSVSSIGSVPAPNEVVESLPVKLFSKLQKHQHEEAAQCYICLVEYDEGDEMRILPCNHEFHKTCIDKWLKEIHRVCPVCRRDICRSEQHSES